MLSRSSLHQSGINHFQHLKVGPKEIPKHLGQISITEFLEPRLTVIAIELNRWNDELGFPDGRNSSIHV